MEVALALLADYANVTKEGGKHRLYVHPKFPQLRATVTRSRSLVKGYIEHALDLAERLSKMEAENGKQC